MAEKITIPSSTHSDQNVKLALIIKKLLQIDIIETYNKSLEFLKTLAAEELPTSLNVEDKDASLNMTGLYYLEIIHH